MLSNLLGKLFGNDSSPRGGSSRNVKHRPAEIGDLLKRYQNENHLLTAVFAMDGQNTKRNIKMSTGIISVDTRQRRFAIDPLIPKESNPLLTPGTVLQFSLSHNGIRHQFDSQWQQTEGTGDKLQHWFAFPKGVEQVQLRDAFRVKFSQAHPIKVALTHAEKPHMTGTIADLSATGMRLRIQGILKPRPVRGEEFTSCHFVLSDGQPIVCIARLVHWQFDPELDTTFLGLQFDHLDGATQRALNRYLTELQRKQRL